MPNPIDYRNLPIGTYVLCKGDKHDLTKDYVGKTFTCRITGKFRPNAEDYPTDFPNPYNIATNVWLSNIISVIGTEWAQKGD